MELDPAAGEKGRRRFSGSFTRLRQKDSSASALECQRRTRTVWVRLSQNRHLTAI
jgi:hypothetical protein